MATLAASACAVRRAGPLWLGDLRGNMIDWLTQRWVCATGRRVPRADVPWIDGPFGRPEGIGERFFDELADANGWGVRRGGRLGLLDDFGALAGPSFEPRAVHEEVAAFYERAAGYDLEAWASWSPVYRPFNGLIRALFSRRLRQLNLPHRALETSRGVTSDVLSLDDGARTVMRAWVRQYVESGRVIYAGTYSVRTPPGHDNPCVTVVFPLPNGCATVVLRPVANADGSLSLFSSGDRFGDPGFYFLVDRHDGTVSVRYLRTFREHIRVYVDEQTGLHADHSIGLMGGTAVRLHYRMRDRAGSGLS